MRVTTQQGAPFPFRHASPDAELDPVVQGIGEAFVAHRAAAADPLRHVLLGALHEQRVRVATLTRRHAGPVADHPHLYTSPLAFTPDVCTADVPQAVQTSCDSSPDHHAL